MEITEQHLSALRGLLAAPMPSSNIAVQLATRGLVDSYLHRVEINDLGRVALARVYRGAEVSVLSDYHLGFMRGQKGVVTGVFRYLDNSVRVEVAFDHPGTWCFYQSADTPLMIRGTASEESFVMGCIFDYRPRVGNSSHDRNMRLSQ